MPLSGYATTGNPYDDAGGDWLPASAQGSTVSAKPDSGVSSFLSSPISTGDLAGKVGAISSLSKALPSITSAMGAIPSISAGGGTSTSGDSQNQQDAAFQYNGAFQVGGSGSLSQSTDSGMGGTDNKMVLYIGLGVISLIALAVLVRR